MLFRITFLGLVILSTLGYCKICPVNGSFEIVEPNSPVIYGFYPPESWQRIPIDNLDSDPRNDVADCYAEVYPSGTIPIDPYSPYLPRPERGQEITWTIPAPVHGHRFVVLSTGDVNGYPDSEITGSVISQEVYLKSGYTILGSYFFGTCDYITGNGSSYNDSGKIYFEFAGDPNNYPHVALSFTVAECDVRTVGSYQSTEEWIPFSYTVEPNMIGPYYLRCMVTDNEDTIFKSYFAVDNLRICPGGLAASDLNQDCYVNLEDFSIISQAWMSFCPDPGSYDPNLVDPNDFTTDPNIPCQLADIDNNWYVDPNDLMFMSDEWLINQ